MRATLSIALAVILGCAAGIASAAQGHRAAGGAVRHSPEPKEPEKTPIDEFERMTPEQQQKALDKLPPERRKKVEAQLAHLRSLPPEQRAMLRQTYNRLNELPPDRQQALRKAFQKFSNQPPGRQQAIREELRLLGDLSSEERLTRFKSPEFRAGFSRGEQQIVRDMADLLPVR
jgi:Protein of unknown function (DUF3106)